MDRCTLFKKCVLPDNQVPNVYEFEYTSHCRSNEDLCGMMAKYFMYADGQDEDEAK